jgi:DNA-binding LacI/PurR family transcriptional regulator
MRMTLKRVAEDLGISRATVSLVLNGRARNFGVSRTTERRVLDYCSEKKYTININARRINSKLTRNVGLVVFGGYTEVDSPLDEPFTARIAGGAAMAAKESGFCASLIVTEQEAEIDSLVERFHARELDGFLLFGFPVAQSWRERFKDEKIPAVIIGGNPADGIPTVNINDYDMSYAITRHIITECGRRKIGFLAGGPRSYVADERKRGFTAALAAAGLKPLFCRECSFREDEAQRYVIQNADEIRSSCDAIVCANDHMAVGAARALLERGVKIPAEIALSGADSDPALKYFSPSISSYTFLGHEQGREAFLLLKELTENRGSGKNIVLTSKLQIGESA